MTKEYALKGLEQVYHGKSYGYFNDDAAWDEYALKDTTDFLYYPHPGTPIAIKIITETDSIIDIAIHFSKCQTHKKYPLFVFLKPNISHNAVFASNYNTACFALTDCFRILPFRVKDKKILLGKKDYSLDDFICNPKYIFNQNKQWVIEDKHGCVDIVEDFDKNRSYYNCHLLEKIEFRPPEKSYKEKLKELFYNLDYDNLFKEFSSIEERYFREHGITDYDEVEDFKSESNILIWEKICKKELYNGNNLPKYVQLVCFNILRARQRKYATRKAIIERNPDYLLNMCENRDSSFDEYVSTVPKQKRKSSLPTIYAYDKTTNELIGEYTSIVEAAQATGADRSNISKCLNGKLKSTENYRFTISILDL